MARCSARVSKDSWHSGQCARNAVVVRGGKPYCKQHDPEYKKKKEQEREAKYNASKCPKCGGHPKPWWAYCPYCGTLLKRRKE